MTATVPTVDYTPYDVCGPLPTGTTLLEASAGTGKTYTIAALATRLVAEGHAELSDLMLVTFSRAATRELRERVREHLLDAHRALAHPEREHDDTVIQRLAAGSREQVGQRRELLRRALSAFDAATISTTHGFCQQMLTELGLAADHDHFATLDEMGGLLADQVVSDLYLQRWAKATDVPLGFADARKVARAALADPHSHLHPADAPEGSVAAARHDIAAAARVEADRRKRARRLFDYDDLLTRLRNALRHPVTGETARARIRARYRYVLVDEFQDTDPVQWEIVKLAFHGSTTLVLIGDPKQAIYAFRGADVYAYLDAAADADHHFTLARNWRSDGPVVTALDRFFGGAALGDPRIVVRQVEAEHTDARLLGAPVAAGLRLRVVRRDQFGCMGDDCPQVAPVKDVVAADVAADIVALLSAGAMLRIDGVQRQVTAGDIAVLVRKKAHADQVRGALAAAGVPAVLTGSRSVFLSPQAREWLVLLRALESPHRSGLVRAAALTSFVGWSATQLATCPDDEIDELDRRMREWRDLLGTRGIAALAEAVSMTQRLAERLLAQPHGERELTDLRHVGQALHGAMSRGELGTSALVQWLQRQIADAKDDQSDERSQRLETDARAVQIHTIHTSKGLEFPVVYVPFEWDRYPQDSDPLRLHDQGERVLWVGGPKADGWKAARARHADEEAGEELRLLYVALTRAKCQAVTWWAATKKNTQSSPLHRMLFGRETDGSVATRPKVPSDQAALSKLRSWAAGTAGCVAVEEVDAPVEVVWSPPATPVPSLDAAVFDRGLDLAWRRTSYSSLTAAAHDAGVGGVGSEPETAERQDEPRVPPAAESAGAGVDEAALLAVPSPMRDLPSGAAFGTTVHSVLESVDTTAGDLAAELRLRCRDVLAGRLSATLDADALADSLSPVMQTPLGPLAGGRTLGDIAPRDRLPELEFELPLVGGDEPREVLATLSAVAALLRRHLAADDPLASYADLLDGPLLRAQPLRGYLTGSIDAVLRVEGPRYLIVDYKTNWLGDYGPSGALPLTAWDYRPAALATAMLHAHYPLQALLYSVALHRYLRWRQPAYDPSAHLGGVLYLFVRGMCGPSTPVVDGVPTGVFSWQPPPDLVVELSAVLDRGVQ